MRYTPVVRSYGTPTVVGAGRRVPGWRNGAKVRSRSRRVGWHRADGRRRGAERSSLGCRSERVRRGGGGGQVPRVGGGRAVSSSAERSRRRRRRRRRACLPAREEPGGRPERSRDARSQWLATSRSVRFSVSGGRVVAPRLLSYHVRRRAVTVRAAARRNRDTRGALRRSRVARCDSTLRGFATSPPPPCAFASTIDRRVDRKRWRNL